PWLPARPAAEPPPAPLPRAIPLTTSSPKPTGPLRTCGAPARGNAPCLLSVAEEDGVTSLIGSGHVVHPEEPQGGPGGRRLQLRRPARSGVPPGDQGARPRKIRPRLPAPPSRLSVPLRAHPREAGGGVRGPARQRANEARRGDRRAE